MYFSASLGTVSSSSQLFNAADYKNMMRIRLDVLRSVVSQGFHVLFSDVDAVFLKNPFEYYRQSEEFDLELCSDAPYIAKNFELEPMMVRADDGAHMRGLGMRMCVLGGV